MDETLTSQFYTGLVAELYEPLVSVRANADHYAPFLERAGAPALELGCGSGLPLLELLQRGYEVEGLDSSADMLARCREKASALGLAPILHHQAMEALSLPRRYRAIYLAGPTFTLLPDDDVALRALLCIDEHLQPGGRLLVPLHVPQREAYEAVLGRARETRGEDGSLLRVTITEMRFDAEARSLSLRLRYEAERPGGTREVLEREQAAHWWQPEHFLALLREAGLGRGRARDLSGAPAAPDAKVFVCQAERVPG
jgi:SAM-dependent methyltransferase